MCKDRERCSVCEDAGNKRDTVLICTECAHPERVRTYCKSCQTRLDLSLEEAQSLFQKAVPHPEDITRGLVFVFEDACPECADIFPAPRIFYINNT